MSILVTSADFRTAFATNERLVQMEELALIKREHFPVSVPRGIVGHSVRLTPTNVPQTLAKITGYALVAWTPTLASARQDTVVWIARSISTTALPNSVRMAVPVWTMYSPTVVHAQMVTLASTASMLLITAWGSHVSMVAPAWIHWLVSSASASHPTPNASAAEVWLKFNLNQ